MRFSVVDSAQAIQDHLKNIFTTFDSYVLSERDQKIAARDPKAFILGKLFRKKFRKQKLFPNTIEDITKKVAERTASGEPIYLSIPFGGYKHFWNASHPEPDWAELFTIKFLTQYVAPILAVYDPGAIIEFVSEDIIIPKMDNYPQESLDSYAAAFKTLLASYQRYLPENLRFQFFRVAERCNRDQIIQEVEKLLPGSRSKWETYTQDQKDRELKRSRRSVFWKGESDLTGLDEQAKQRRVIESRHIELAYYEVEARPEFLGPYFLNGNHIPVCFSFGLSPDNFDHWITLGSTHSSVVDFWIGRGILEQRDSSFVTRIVSKQQYDRIKNRLRSVETKFGGVLPLKNYQCIEVIRQSDWPG